MYSLVQTYWNSRLNGEPSLVFQDASPMGIYLSRESLNKVKSQLGREVRLEYCSLKKYLKDSPYTPIEVNNFISLLKDTLGTDVILLYGVEEVEEIWDESILLEHGISLVREKNSREVIDTIYK